MATRSAYEVILRGRGAVAVLLQEITVAEMLLATRSMPKADLTAKTPAGAAVVATELSRQGLRMSVVRTGKVDADDEITWAEHLNHTALMGAGWRRAFPRSRHTFDLMKAWTEIHLPGEEVVDEAAATIEYLDEKDGFELVSFKMVIDGIEAVVILRELDVDAVGQVMRRGAKEASPLASDLLQTMEGLSRSIVTVNGEKVDFEKGTPWPFSVKDTYALGRIWRDIHIGDGGAVGEVRAVSTPE